jgi:DNA repair exonuclease SbcCD nuclease subunit
MERTKINRIPSAILTSDWHLREDTPICYTGDYQKEQWNSVDFISELQRKWRIPVLHGGDLFDHWKPSPWLIRMAIEHIPDQFITIYGQHDLPQHNLELVNKCGINVLQAAHKLIVSDQCHWGQIPSSKSNLNHILNIPSREILIWHKMNYQGRLPWPGCTDPISAALLRKYKQYDLILTGDNHKPFTEEYEGRILVNPGSLMRMDANQIDHKPRVYLWFAETNEIQPIYIPIVANVISREHLDIKKDRDLRIEAFVSRLNSDWEADMSFEDNLDQFFKTNKTREPIKQIIYKSIE